MSVTVTSSSGVLNMDSVSTPKGSVTPDGISSTTPRRYRALAGNAKDPTHGTPHTQGRVAEECGLDNGSNTPLHTPAGRGCGRGAGASGSTDGSVGGKYNRSGGSNQGMPKGSSGRVAGDGESGGKETATPLTSTPAGEDMDEDPFRLRGFYSPPSEIVTPTSPSTNDISLSQPPCAVVEHAVASVRRGGYLAALSRHESRDCNSAPVAETVQNWAKGLRGSEKAVVKKTPRRAKLDKDGRAGGAGSNRRLSTHSPTMMKAMREESEASRAGRPSLNTLTAEVHLINST